ncbi:RyR domain-containing protein [Pseudomonas sp. NPDC077649]|uniref:RyR domain-containing protein n=1 Tax=Pseudomonas sp. NPDC077649 TaxID=3364423 RepID=UPI0037C97DB4
MKVLVIARVAHAINAAYCLSLGDASVPTWEEAGEQHQKSLVAGVEMHLANPDSTPEQAHESWLAQKLADGWVYGEVKDTEKKVHPCCLPYDQLPADQKSKDYLFRAVVHALKDLPDADEAAAAAVAAALAKVPAGQSAPTAPAGPGKIVVVYIGRKETYTDHLYGTGLSFVKGQERAMPADIARKFLRHGDMFSEGQAIAAAAEPAADKDDDDTSKVLDEAKKCQDEERKQEERLLDLKQQINVMTKKSLTDYAMTNYRQKLDQQKSVSELRQLVTGMIDQYGPVGPV